jgi:cytochrome d ubiquinol oxidase subunit II
VILFPSLALLFRLTLAGRLAHGDEEAPRVSPTSRRTGSRTRLALAALIAGIGFLTVASSGWAHALGVTCLLAFVAVGYRSALPADT